MSLRTIAVEAVYLLAALERIPLHSFYDGAGFDESKEALCDAEEEIDSFYEEAIDFREKFFEIAAIIAPTEAEVDEAISLFNKHHQAQIDKKDILKEYLTSEIEKAK